MASFLANLQAARDSVTADLSRRASRISSSNRAFLNAAASGAALIIVADGKIEDDELDDALQFFTKNPTLAAWTTVEKNTLFQGILKSLQVLLAKGVDNPDYKMKQSELMGTIAALAGKPEAVTLAEVIILLANSDGDFAEPEKKMAKRIIGRSLQLDASLYID